MFGLGSASMSVKKWMKEWIERVWRIEKECVWRSE